VFGSDRRLKIDHIGGIISGWCPSAELPSYGCALGGGYQCLSVQTSVREVSEDPAETLGWAVTLDPLQNKIENGSSLKDREFDSG
jgi:hypothetical protein